MFSVRDGLKIGDMQFTIVASSQKGPYKDVNQDSFDIYYDKNQIIVCVADGLGSAIKSAEGSEEVVKSAISLLKDSNSMEGFCLNLFSDWKSRIDDNLDLYDTTCKFLKITPDYICFGGVGDGWILIDKEDGFEEYSLNKTFSNQTSSMLAFDLEEDFKVHFCESSKFNAALISTDGFSDDFKVESAESVIKESTADIIKDSEEYGKYLDKLLLDWPIPTNVDDKTAIFIVKISD